MLMVAIDRPGYGQSDSVDDQLQYTWVDIKDDLVALADSLGHQRFVLCGFSIGSSWAMQVAAQIPSRVQGIILFGAMCDAEHPQMDKDTRNKVGRPPAILNPQTGCCGCILRSAFAGGVKTNAKYDFKECFKREATLPKCKAGWEKFQRDPFWVCTKVE